MPDTVQTLHNIFSHFILLQFFGQLGKLPAWANTKSRKEGGHPGTELVVAFSRFAILPGIPSLGIKARSVWF